MKNPKVLKMVPVLVGQNKSGCRHEGKACNFVSNLTAGVSKVMPMVQKRYDGIFVTGTDTDVGKTFVSSALLAGWRSEGVDAVHMKPVQKGCVRRNGTLVAPDLVTCLKSCGLRPSRDELGDMAPYCFKPACSPHLAAREAGVRISLPVIEQAFRRLGRTHDAVIVEGAGGVLVPLNEQQTMLDLMVRLQLPVLLVARACLGTLNHTLLSLDVVRRSGLAVAGVVVNQSVPGKWGRIEEDNVRMIRQRGKTCILGCIRYGDKGVLSVPFSRFRS